MNTTPKRRKKRPAACSMHDEIILQCEKLLELLDEPHCLKRQLKSSVRTIFTCAEKARDGAQAMEDRMFAYRHMFESYAQELGFAVKRKPLPKSGNNGI